MLCGYDLEALLLDSRPPDEEMVDLIEWAFLEGQIDGLTADLAHLWLRAQLLQVNSTDRAGR